MNTRGAPYVSGKRVAVLGAARSGRAVASLLKRHGADVFVSDAGSITESAQDSFNMEGITYEASGHTELAWQADFVVASPGVPDEAEPMREALLRGTPLYSEIEVASWFCDAHIIAITGSNGKTTTTELLGHLFRKAGRNTFVCGNVGRPFSDDTDRTGPDDLVVLEVSSFQLDHIDSFRPDVSILLNITPDHLDRYNEDIERYAASKLRICENQTGVDTFIFNQDDERIARFIHKRVRGPIALGISITEEIRAAGFLRNSDLMLRINDQEENLMPTEKLALRGRHNVYNSLAAAVAARVVEVRSDVVRESLRSFEGVPHRLETVRDIDGVRYINDSKATNVNALWYALESFTEPVVLIAGGRDKGNDYSGLKSLVQTRVRALITIGEAAEAIQAELGEFTADGVTTESLDEAVKLAHLLARPGDVVLLSPACASFDMFDSYEHRGDQFKQIVSNL